MTESVRDLKRLLILICTTLVATGTYGEPWRQWGGATRDFRVESGALAESWAAEGPTVLWRTKLTGGYSGILVEEDHVYTAMRSGLLEVLVALDAESGEILWQVGEKMEPYESQVLEFGTGPNATPLLFEDYIVFVGFTGRLYAAHKGRGELVWKHDLVKEFGAKIHRFGYANAPLAHRDLLIVGLGGDQHGAVGFEPATGKVRWRTPPFDTSYAAPSVVKVGEEEQLVFMASTEVLGVSLDDGAIRWRHPHKNRYGTNCLGPLWNGEDLLFISSQADGGSMTLRLTSEDGKTKVEEVARSKNFRIFYNNAILSERFVYGSTGNFLAAFNYLDGKIAWKQRGFPKLNLVTADGKALGLDENGKLHLLRLSPQGLKVLDTHQLLEKPAWTPPTLVGTRLYVRNQGEIVAVELAASTAADNPSSP